MGKRYWYGFVIPKVLMTQNGYVRWNHWETMSGRWNVNMGDLIILGSWNVTPIHFIGNRGHIIGYDSWRFSRKIVSALVVQPINSAHQPIYNWGEQIN